MTHHDLQQFYNLTGKTLVITGGTGVLGSEMVAAFAGLGANVAALSRSGSLSTETAEQVKAGLGQVMALRADVLQREALLEAEAAIRQRFGPTDILINAAGGNVNAASTHAQSFFDIPEEALRYATDLNLLGTVLPSQVFGRGMAERKEGVIINVSSMAAIRPSAKSRLTPSLRQA